MNNVHILLFSLITKRAHACIDFLEFLVKWCFFVTWRHAFQSKKHFWYDCSLLGFIIITIVSTKVPHNCMCMIMPTCKICTTTTASCANARLAIKGLTTALFAELQWYGHVSFYSVLLIRVRVASGSRVCWDMHAMQNAFAAT